MHALVDGMEQPSWELGVLSFFLIEYQPSYLIFI